VHIFIHIYSCICSSVGTAVRIRAGRPRSVDSISIKVNRSVVLKMATQTLVLRSQWVVKLRQHEADRCHPSSSVGMTVGQ
jgi:hypothetical protein